MRDLSTDELEALSLLLDNEIHKTQQSIKLYGSSFGDKVIGYLQDSIEYYANLKNKLEERRKELENGRN